MSNLQPHRFTKAEMAKGGRKSGVVRLNTSNVNRNMQKYIEGIGEFDGKGLLDDLLTLTPKDRLNFLMAWMPFQMPKLAAIEQVVEVTELNISKEDRVKKIKNILMKAS